MISRVELRKISRARLKDAEILYNGKRYDGAVYLCGYAIELALKARVCKALNWSGFPETNNEFKLYSSFKTHNFTSLLRLSSIEDKIITHYFTDWSVVAGWDPESRYNAVGSATAIQAHDMIESTKILIKALT